MGLPVGQACTGSLGTEGVSMYGKRSWGSGAKEISEWGVGDGEEGWEGFEAFAGCVFCWCEVLRSSRNAGPFDSAEVRFAQHDRPCLTLVCEEGVNAGGHFVDGGDYAMEGGGLMHGK